MIIREIHNEPYGSNEGELIHYHTNLGIMVCYIIYEFPENGRFVIPKIKVEGEEYEESQITLNSGQMLQLINWLNNKYTGSRYFTPKELLNKVNNICKN